MAVSEGNLEAELIKALCVRVRERLPSEQAAPCTAFVRQYYHWIPAEDLADRSLSNLYGAAMAHWRAAKRRPARATIPAREVAARRTEWRKRLDLRVGGSQDG